MSSDVCSICGSYECNESKCKIKNILKCLDEIEKILQEYHPLFVDTPLYMIDKVIRQIKEVKGNG